MSRQPWFSNSARGGSSQEKLYREAFVHSTFGRMSWCDSLGLMWSQQVSDGGLSQAVHQVKLVGPLGEVSRLSSQLGSS